MIYADNNLSIAENLEILSKYLQENPEELKFFQKYVVVGLVKEFFSDSGLSVWDGDIKTNRIKLKSSTLYIEITFKKFRQGIKFVPDKFLGGIHNKICEINSEQIQIDINARENRIAKEKFQIMEVNEILKKYNIDLDILTELKKLPDILRFSKEALSDFYPEYVI